MIESARFGAISSREARGAGLAAPVVPYDGLPLTNDLSVCLLERSIMGQG
jgi:hypothetical protein